MRHDEILKVMFSEVVPGVLAAVKLDGKPEIDSELLLCRNDINDKYFELLSSAPFMYKSLSLIHEQATHLQHVLDIAKQQAPALKNDPTMKGLYLSFELIERLCVDAQNYAQVGSKRHLETFMHEK